jgi:hypothetical protein
LALTGQLSAFADPNGRYGCCDAGSYMANPELNPFNKTNACQNCSSGTTTFGMNDELSCTIVCVSVIDGICTACSNTTSTGCSAVACNAGFYESGAASNDLGCSGVCTTVSGSMTRTCNAAGAAGVQTVKCNAGFYETGTAGHNLGCSSCAAGSKTNTGTNPGATTCTPCATGLYSLSSNVAACSICTPIAHATTVQCTTASDQKITFCDAGYYGNIGDSSCQTSQNVIF